MNIPFRTRRARLASFTLAELLVAMAILSIMLVFLGLLLSSVTQVATAGQQQAQNSNNARAILDLMTRELEAGMNRPDLVKNWITNEPGPLTFYTRNVGSGIENATSQATASDYRGLSYVTYNLNQGQTNSTLQRGDASVSFSDPATTTFGSPPAIANTADVLDGVLAFQVTYELSDGSYTNAYAPTNNPYPIAVGISLALVDKSAYTALTQSQKLEQLVQDITNAIPAYSAGTFVTPKNAWESALSANSLNLGNYSPQVRSGLHFFERYINFPPTNL